jgi:hypothetical protein
MSVQPLSSAKWIHLSTTGSLNVAISARFFGGWQATKIAFLPPNPRQSSPSLERLVKPWLRRRLVERRQTHLARPRCQGNGEHENIVRAILPGARKPFGESHKTKNAERAISRRLALTGVEKKVRSKRGNSPRGTLFVTKLRIARRSHAVDCK